MTGDDVTFVDGIPADVMSKVGRVKRVEPQRPHHDLSGFAVNMLPGGHPPGFVEDVVDWFDDRYDVDRFGHDDVVGVIIVDAEDPSTVFPVGLWDTVAVDRAGADEAVVGGVSAIGRSGELRVRGVGAADIHPFSVNEVTKRYTDDE